VLREQSTQTDRQEEARKARHRPDGNEVHSRSRVNVFEVNELEHLKFDREPVVRQHLGSEPGCIKQVLWSSVDIDENIEV
jgi:hypothetical protein